VQHGGTLIAVKSLPSRAPGVTEGPRGSAGVVQISQALTVSGIKNVKVVASTADVGATIGAILKPDVAISPATPEVGFIHRKLADADIYFIANTDNRPHIFGATFRTPHARAEWWDPMSGKVADLGATHTLTLILAPYESRVLVFQDGTDTREASTGAPVEPLWPRLGQTFDGMFHVADTRPEIDLSRDWKVSFEKTHATESMPVLESWTEFEGEKYYSGTATYERTVEIPEDVAKAGRVALDFGEGTPVPREQLHQAGTRTWYDPPIREAALVYVNGKLAGSLWHPPYQIDVGPLLHTGTNQLKIVVANTAINELAGRAAPDYRLLNLRYGEKFTPQDMDHLEPLPSGIVARVRLIWGQ
jgi:glycosyl hydrolase family 106( putative alpha-L-rhamnosidase)